jgi:hypothetical protein
MATSVVSMAAAAGCSCRLVWDQVGRDGDWLMMVEYEGRQYGSVLGLQPVLAASTKFKNRVANRQECVPAPFNAQTMCGGITHRPWLRTASSRSQQPAATAAGNRSTAGMQLRWAPAAPRPVQQQQQRLHHPQLTARLKAAASPQELLALLQQHGDALNPIHVSTAFTGLKRLRPTAVRPRPAAAGSAAAAAALRAAPAARQLQGRVRGKTADKHHTRRCLHPLDASSPLVAGSAGQAG